MQRRRNHKVRDVVGCLPQDQHEQARSTLKAAFNLDAKQGTAQIERYVSWLEQADPSAAASLREGNEEPSTMNRLGRPSRMRRYLRTTNLIDNGHAVARDRLPRVKHWQSSAMAWRSFGHTPNDPVHLPGPHGEP